MEDHEYNNRNKMICNNQEAEVRKGPWTMEEDLILMNYIATHGEGVWNTLARSAGLKRTGKSCRLRWLNYLRPDVRRGNITQEEQLLILELHSRWGNRWSKIARHLPGRTDNEIKNYWRTRIQKKAKHGESLEYQNPINSDGAGSSQVGSIDHNAPPSYTGISVDNPDDSAAPFCSETCENFWSTDDFWAMPYFNGE